MKKEIKEFTHRIYCVYSNHPDFIGTNRVPTLEQCQAFIKCDDRLSGIDKAFKLKLYPWKEIVKQVGEYVIKHRKHYISVEELISMVNLGNKPLIQISETDDEDFKAGCKFRVLDAVETTLRVDDTEFHHVNLAFYEDLEDETDASSYKWFHLSHQCNMEIGDKKFLLLHEGR